MAAALAIAACLGTGLISSPAPAAGVVGLSVSVDGVLHRDGKPYRAIGVNYFDAFYRHLKNPADTSFDAGFKALAEAKIPFARIMGGGYWPTEQKLYKSNRVEFFTRFDRVIRAAEKHGVGLIPSLFWDTACVPDLVGEPRSAWGNTRSKTHAYMRSYIKDVVTRYRSSSAIWGWEFGNEYSLAANLPNASEWRPPVVPALGTPRSRSAADDLTYEAIRTAFTAFAREVRKYDKTRIITTGNAFPRPSAWHNWREGTWTTDTPEQTAEMLSKDNPAPADVISVHVYDDDIARLPAAASTATRLRKPLFVGEFGTAGPGRTTTRRFTELLTTIETSGAAIAAVWVYDYPAQPEFSVTRTNGRAWQLNAIAAANSRLARR